MPANRLRAKMVDREFLREFSRFDFFRSISADAVGELASRASFSSCSPGTILFLQGQSAEEIFILLRGRVKQFVHSSEDKRLTFHIAKPGEILGLTSAVRGDPHRISAEASHLCELVSIRTTDFLPLLTTRSEIGRAVAHELVRCYEQACARLYTVGGTTSNTARLARLLLEWAQDGRETESGTQIHIALRHAEIAECIGTCRETITRILRRFQQRRILTVRGSFVTIIDRAALERCAEMRLQVLDQKR